MPSSSKLAWGLEALGAVCIGYGLWLVWYPGAFIWAGLVCIALAYIFGKGEKK